MALQPSVVPDTPQADPGVRVTVVDEAMPTIGVVADPSLVVHRATTESSRFAVKGLLGTQLAPVRARAHWERLTGNPVMPHAVSMEAAVAIAFIRLRT